jgi:hypothetical protein
MPRREHRGRHEPLLITIETPGQKLTLGRADGTLIMCALADAEGYRHHLNDLERAGTYRDLAARLAGVLPLPESAAGL